MIEEIPNGTQVLIFDANDEFRHEEDKEERYIRGVVISNKESEDLSYHGSPWYERIYMVMGEDGKKYQATHNHAAFGISDFYIKTITEHMNYVMTVIKENHEKINRLNEKNATLSAVITSLIKIKNASYANSTVKTKRLKPNNKI